MSDLAPKTHFEILAFTGHSWRIIGVADKERDALKKAKALKLHAQRSAVKVLRETTRGQDIQTVQIYFHGTEPKQVKNEGEREKAPLICWRASDFYSFEGRRLIGLLLHDILQRWQITPKELVSHLPHFQRLEDEGQLLKSCVQKTAVDQMSGSGESVQKRMRTIFDLIAQAAKRLDENKKTGAIPDLKAGGLESAIHGLEHHSQRAYLLSAAVAAHLADFDDFGTKLDYMLEIFSNRPPAWVAIALDGFLAELLLPPHQIDRLSPDDADSVTQLVNVQMLRCNKGIFSIEGLVETPLALEKSIIRHIRQTRQFGDGELVSEISGLAGLWGIFEEDATRPNEFAWQLSAGFSKRSQAILSEKNISDAAQGFGDILDRLEFLMRLESFAIGTPSHRRLSRYVAKDLTGSALKAQLQTQSSGPLYHLLRLAQVQREVQNSHFENRMKNRFIKACDNLSMMVMGQFKILDQVLSPIENRHEQALKLLELISDGYFCEGETLSLVKSTLSPLLKGSRLTEHLLSSAENDKDRVEKLQYIMSLLTKAGFAA